MRHRLFTAVPFPADLNSNIVGLRSKLHFDLDWEKPQRLHLTLNFLGNITDEQLPNLQKKLISAISNIEPSKLHFGFLQTIYRKHEGSYLCLTPDKESQEIIDLQESLKNSVYHMGVPVADRFWPHITIAKLPKADPVSIKALLDKIDSLDLKTRFTLPIESVALIESKNDRSGTHYSRIASYPLQ